MHAHAHIRIDQAHGHPSDSIDPIGTRALPVSTRPNGGTKMHYRVATEGVSSTFLIIETPPPVCSCLTKEYYY